MKYTIPAILLALSFMNNLSAMEKNDNSNFYAISVPGQSACGCGSYNKNFIINSKRKHFETLHTWKIDLGQGNCMKRFQEQFDQLDQDQDTKDKNLLLTGVAQGTATLVNWLAEQPEETQKRVKGLVLESVLGNGNSAITHTIENMISSKATYLPFSRLWLPWAGKTSFPTYNPYGKQALKSAKKLPKDLPVVIIHAENDPQLSINDARKLYVELKKNGNDNAYLFEVKSEIKAHIDILDWEKSDSKKKITALQYIYKKHGLPYNENLLVLDNEKVGNLDEFQPTIDEVEKRINDSTFASRWTRNAIDITTAGLAAGYIAYKYWFSKK